MAGKLAVIKPHNLEDSLIWTVACSPVLIDLPPLCFPHWVCFASLTSRSFPSSPHLVCDLGCKLDEVFDPGYRSPSYKAARFSFLALPLPASLDLIHKLMKCGFHSPARRQGASLLVGITHSFPLPPLPGSYGSILITLLGGMNHLLFRLSTFI